GWGGLRNLQGTTNLQPTANFGAIRTLQGGHNQGNIQYMSKQLAALFDEKNQMIVKGQLSEARERFYADDVRVTDFDGTVVWSKKEFIETRQKFVGSIGKVHEITLLKTAVGVDVTFAEFIFDFEMN